jgi:hypothetical protein
MARSVSTMLKRESRISERSFANWFSSRQKIEFWLRLTLKIQSFKPMRKPLTRQEIITRFYQDRILFCILGVPAGFGIVVLMASPGLEGVIGMPVWVLQVLAVAVTITSMIWMLSLGNCPACGGSPFSNSRNPFPARCKSCGVRLL